MGFDVDIGALFQSPDEVARQAVDADVHVVGISSQAAGHNVLVPALLESLRKAGMDNVLVVVGGIVPPKDAQALLEHGAMRPDACGCLPLRTTCQSPVIPSMCTGVHAVFGPGTRIPSAAASILGELQKRAVHD